MEPDNALTNDYEDGGERGAEAIADAILAAGTPDEHGIVWVADPCRSAFEADDFLEEDTSEEDTVFSRSGKDHFSDFVVYAPTLPSGRTLVWTSPIIRYSAYRTVIAVVDGDPPGWADAIHEWAEETWFDAVLSPEATFWHWYLRHDESVLGTEWWPWDLEEALPVDRLVGDGSDESHSRLERLVAAIDDELDGEGGTPERGAFLWDVSSVLDDLGWLSANDQAFDALVALVADPAATAEGLRNFAIAKYRELLDGVHLGFMEW